VLCVAGIAFDGCVGQSVGSRDLEVNSEARIWQAKQGVGKLEGADHPKWTNGQSLFYPKVRTPT
jgi:hypothetical protein